VNAQQRRHVVSRDAVGEEQRSLCTHRDATFDLAEPQELLKLQPLVRGQGHRHGPAAAVWTIGPRRRVDHDRAVTPTQ
jgi:hypothetical protein